MQSVKVMNSYNLFEEKESSVILYHAIADSEERVVELAKEACFDIEGLVIELEKNNVKDQLGKPFSERIEDVVVR